MDCLFVIFAEFFPRLALFLIWLARPAYFSGAFGGGWLWPILGVLFLPFTTLLYVVFLSPSGGLAGLDWLWLAIAVVLDLSHAGGSGYVNRGRVPAYRHA